MYNAVRMLVLNFAIYIKFIIIITIVIIFSKRSSLIHQKFCVVTGRHRLCWKVPKSQDQEGSFDYMIMAACSQCLRVYTC